MAVVYNTLGPNKQLNTIVIAGTHDAGITSGGGSVKTQKLNIGQQAAAGVRIFDLRITGAAVGKNRVSGSVELKTYHGALMAAAGGKRNLRGTTVPTKMEVTVRSAAPGTEFGQDLVSILQQARAFVTSPAGQGEFLILKFDKCNSWLAIATLCRDELGAHMYGANGVVGPSLNLATVADLAGKVVVLFSQKGLAEVNASAQTFRGLLGFKNLSGGAPFDPTFTGLQYYGKGGTSVTGTERNASKIQENIDKQSALMAGAAATGDHRIVRMVYWTTTGSIWNIEKRDKEMWQGENIRRFHDLWAGGMRDYYKGLALLPIPANNPLAGTQLQTYVPNIVMIDFADDRKCQIIRNLNGLAAPDFAALQYGLKQRLQVAQSVMAPPAKKKGLFG